MRVVGTRLRGTGAYKVSGTVESATMARLRAKLNVSEAPRQGAKCRWTWRQPASWRRPFSPKTQERLTTAMPATAPCEGEQKMRVERAAWLVLARRRRQRSNPGRASEGSRRQPCRWRQGHSRTETFASRRRLRSPTCRSDFRCNSQNVKGPIEFRICARASESFESARAWIGVSSWKLFSLCLRSQRTLTTR